MFKGLRLGVRAVILHQDRLLLVNAYKKGRGPVLWCAPGGGVEPHQSLPENLRREVLEETGLTIDVGRVVLINEFHDPALKFHQVEIFFRATIVDGALSDAWKDPEGIVETRRLFTRNEVQSLPLKPSSLPDIAFGADTEVVYDPLEHIIR